MDPALVERARAVPGTWRLLVVAVDGCSDSVSTIPWLAENEVTGDAAYPEKMRRYEEDAGRSTVAQIVEVLEAAAAGEVVSGG